MEKINLEETQTPDERDEDFWNKFRSFHQFYFQIRNYGFDSFDSNGDFDSGEDCKKYDSAFLLQAGLDYFLEREDYLKCADLNRWLIEVKKRRAANSIADSSDTTATSTIKK